MKIAPGVYQLKIPIPDNPLGHLNCYIIEGTTGWLMVDTGWNAPDAFIAMEARLKDLGLSVSDINTMVVTHVHPDHFGLAGKIKHMSPATQLITHQWESDLIESRYIKFADLRTKISSILERHGVPEEDLTTLKSASMPALQYVTITLPDITVYGGETISTGIYDLEVIWTPGHSPGHICLWEPRNRLLFVGDHILPTTSPNISYHAQSGDNPLGDYVAALRKVQNLPAAHVLPAHEYIFTELQDRIRQLIAHHETRKAEIQRAIMKEPLTAYEVSSHITWDTPGMTWERMPPLHKRLAVTETIAHLECMRWEGRVTRIIKDKRLRYISEE